MESVLFCKCGHSEEDHVFVFEGSKRSSMCDPDYDDCRCEQFTRAKVEVKLDGIFGAAGAQWYTCKKVLPLPDRGLQYQLHSGEVGIVGMYNWRIKGKSNKEDNSDVHKTRN